jgi:eIF4-gamma/eIF5/eIF2-epsilon
MATKKFKGKKEQLSLFVGAGSSVSGAVDLPTGPSGATRDSLRGGRGGYDRQGSDRYENRSEREGGWGRSERAQPGDDFGRRSNGDDESSWGRRQPPSFGGGGGGYGGGGGAGESSGYERPRLNLAPRTVSAPTAVEQTADGTASGPGQTAKSDKWDTIFGGGSRRPQTESSFSSSGYRERDGNSRFDSFAGNTRTTGSRLGSRYQEGDEDPRFAGKFGNQSRASDDQFPSQEPSKNVGAIASVTTAVEGLEVSQESKQSAQADGIKSTASAAGKPSKSAKALAREEAAARAKEQREAAEKKAEEEKKILEQEEASSRQICIDLLATGLTGDALMHHVSTLERKPTGSALISYVLSSIQDPLPVKWCQKCEFGAVILSLVGADVKKQVRAIYAIQAHFNKLKFPKVDVKGQSRSVLELVFQSAYQHELFDEAAFIAWSEDDSDAPGKLTAIVQTTNFIALLNSQEEEEYDDDEVDAPLPTI